VLLFYRRIVGYAASSIWIRQRILQEETIVAKFVLLYSGGSMAESEAEQAAVMEKWGAWFGNLGSALVDGGSPFSPSVRHVASDGAVAEGPIGGLATGYSIIEAPSLDEASKLAQSCPVLMSGGQISVYESLNVM
jgi:hypothetical protein